jgi:hypothetical protein
MKISRLLTRNFGTLTSSEEHIDGEKGEPNHGHGISNDRPGSISCES